MPQFPYLKKGVLILCGLFSAALPISQSIFCPSLPCCVPQGAAFCGPFSLGALAFCLPVGLSQSGMLLGDPRWEERQVRYVSASWGHYGPGSQGCWLGFILQFYLLTGSLSSMSQSSGQAGLVTLVCPLALSGVVMISCRC